MVEVRIELRIIFLLCLLFVSLFGLLWIHTKLSLTVTTAMLCSVLPRLHSWPFTCCSVEEDC